MKRLLFIRRFFLAGCLIAFATPAPAVAEMREAPETVLPGEPPGDDSFVDTAHERISGAFLTSADWLDSFFDEETHESEDNRSRLRLRADMFVEEGDSAAFELGASLRITFPRTNERLQLIVLGNEDEEDVLDDGRPAGRIPESRGDEEGFSVGLRYFLTQTARENFGIGTGLRGRSGTIVGFIGPRWRIFLPLGSWDFRSVQRARWFTDDGWEWLSRFDLERPVLGRRMLFRSRTDIEWFEDDEGLFPEQRFSLFHPLDTWRALKYEWINRFVTEPGFELDDLILRFRYRQRIWRDWLFVELGPDASFPEDRDREFTPGFFVRLEAIIGAYNRLPIPGNGDSQQ